MKAVMSSVLPEIVAFRKRTGADRWDEMWEGVLHMPPSPSPEHQDFEWALETYLRSHWANRKGYKVYHNVNLASVGGWPNDYRIPDLILLTPDSGAVQKGVYFEGPPHVVIEIRSPEDETLEKLPFYAALGVPEVWIFDGDTKVPQVHVRQGKTYETRAPEPNGWILSEITGIELRSSQPGELSIRLQGDESTLEHLPKE